MTKVRVVVCACVVLAGAGAGAQQPPAKPDAAQQPGAKPAPGQAPAAGAEQPPPPAVAGGQAYTYDPQGRRDPFVSLLSRGSDPRSASNRPAGLPGLLIAEVAVKGIIKDRTGFIALIQGPNTKTFSVRPGEKLMDGTVKAITADTVVFAQDVNDPLSMVKQKEVRKTLRSNEGGRN